MAEAVITTPLLDIKSYTARFDRIDTTRNGWQDEVDEETARNRGTAVPPVDPTGDVRLLLQAYSGQGKMVMTTRCSRQALKTVRQVETDIDGEGPPWN